MCLNSNYVIMFTFILISLENVWSPSSAMGLIVSLLFYYIGRFRIKLPIKVDMPLKKTGRETLSLSLLLDLSLSLSFTFTGSLSLSLSLIHFYWISLFSLSISMDLYLSLYLSFGFIGYPSLLLDLSHICFYWISLASIGSLSLS